MLQAPEGVTLLFSEVAGPDLGVEEPTGFRQRTLVLTWLRRDAILIFFANGGWLRATDGELRAGSRIQGPLGCAPSLEVPESSRWVQSL